jgi:hypothetical protein
MFNLENLLPSCPGHLCLLVICSSVKIVVKFWFVAHRYLAGDNIVYRELHDTLNGTVVEPIKHGSLALTASLCWSGNGQMIYYTATIQATINISLVRW